MEYFTSRNKLKKLNTEDLYLRFSALIEDFICRNYFKEKTSITELYRKYDSINRKSTAHIGFNVFPIDNWTSDHQVRDEIFDAIEFLFKFISEPGEWGWILTEYDYVSYNTDTGRSIYVSDLNLILNNYDEGFELSNDGEILFKGNDSENFIELDFSEYNLKNVDQLIKKAIKLWKSRNQSLDEKKQAIINLANVFEFLKSEGTLEKVLNTKDSKDLFNIANNFALRHHDKNQKSDYDQEIWYDWIMQFYLATCITTLKLIKKNIP